MPQTAALLTPTSGEPPAQFVFNTQPAIVAAPGGAAQGPRKFSGTAYSGEMIRGHWYWDNLVFDLTTMSVPAKLPALIDHDRGARCGYVTESSTEGSLTVRGNLLSNEHGRAIAAESDEGFPWQMSVHIEPGTIEKVLPGTDVQVNGKTFAGPVTVFRNSTIKEVSFTATGWDSQTTAAAMSRGNQPSNQAGDDDDMDLKELQAKLDASKAENEALKAAKADADKALGEANERLAKFSADARTGAIKHLFSDTGREYKDDDAEVVKLSKLTQEAFDITAEMLRSQFKRAGGRGTPDLFSHSAGSGREEPGTDEARQFANENPLMADAKRRAESAKRPH